MSLFLSVLSGIIDINRNRIITIIICACLEAILVYYLIRNIFGLFLFKAVRHENLKEIQQLIYYGANINVIDCVNSTPLHIAALYGRTEIALVLIENGADVNATDQSEFTPLHFTINKNKQDTALAIIHYGKVPYADIPIIEGNPTSKYIQQQYQLAAKHFTGLNPSLKDTIMARMNNIFIKYTGYKYIYWNMMALLCKKKLPQEMVKMIMRYGGLNFNNLDIDVLTLKSSDLLPTVATTPISHRAQESIKPNTPMLGA